MCHSARERAARIGYPPREKISEGADPDARSGGIGRGVELLPGGRRGRPQVAAPAELREELERFDPPLVVCGVRGRPDPGDVLAWVELPAEVGRPKRVRVGGGRREAPSLTLEGLVGVLDEAEALVREKENRARDRGPKGPIRPIA